MITTINVRVGHLDYAAQIKALYELTLPELAEFVFVGLRQAIPTSRSFSYVGSVYPGTAEAVESFIRENPDSNYFCVFATIETKKEGQAIQQHLDETQPTFKLVR